MARRPRGEKTPLLETRGRFAVFAGLAAFVILDVVLIVIAVHGVAAEPEQSPGPIPTFTSPATPASEPTPSVTPTPSGTAAPASSVSGAVPLLSAITATEAWRATPGVCTGTGTATATPAKIEHTTDGGATWNTVDLGTNAVDDVVALSAGSTRESIVGGRGASCTVAATASYTEGKFWATSPGDVASMAYVTPSGTSVHLSSGTVDAPCANPERVVEGATQTVLLCDDGLRVRQGAGSWVPLDLSGLVAVVPSSGAFTVARTGVSGCGGIDIQSLALPLGASTTPQNLGCATAEPGAAPLTAADVTLSSTGSTLWLWSGDTTMVSTDGGVTW